LFQSNRAVRSSWKRLIQTTKIILVNNSETRFSTDQSTTLIINCFSIAISTEELDDNIKFLQNQRDVKLSAILIWIKIDYICLFFAIINLDRLEYISQLTYCKTIYQFYMSNVNSYIDILDKTYTRLDFVRAILKSEIKKLLIYIENYLKTAYLAIFRYSVNRKLFCKTTSTSSW